MLRAAISSIFAAQKRFVQKEEDSMSRVNGEKARAAIARKRRTAQRLKDRTRRAELATKSTAAPAPAPEKKAAPARAAKKPATA